ncbi:hypothetical protein PG985_013482 [Apiospora marii]|uniref:Uncharacterized protein n=1 Tax=Apiospora marii TaxID=335849 RepID=A0ABR1R7T9_9PEZI
MPPKSKAKAKAAGNSGLTQAELKNLYIEGTELLLTYFNGDTPTNNFYKKLLAKQKYKSLQAAARNWCWKYAPERANVSKTVANFQSRFPLHEHGGYSHEVKTSAGPYRESMDLDPNEPDNPWLLFHPDLFNQGVSPNYYRFSLERARTARTMQGYEDNDELNFRDYKEYIPNAPTARRLAGDRFQYALRVVERMADEEDVAIAEAMEEQKEQNRKDQEKQKKKSKAKKSEQEDEEEDEEEGEEMPPPAVVTARDLLLDRVLLRYLPEALVWLGHGPKAWREVRISDAQTRVYRTINMTNSAQMMHMRAEAIRLEQIARGEILPEKNATPFALYQQVLDERMRKTAEEEKRKQEEAEQEAAQEAADEAELKKAQEEKKAKAEEKKAKKEKKAAEKKEAAE